MMLRSSAGTSCSSRTNAAVGRRKPMSCTHASPRHRRRMRALNFQVQSRDDIVRDVTPKLLIGGRFEDSASGKTFPVIDPRNEEAYLQVAEADAPDVDRAVRAARRAFDEGPWPRMTAKERGRMLYRLADLIEEHAEEFAALETLDVGKPLAMSSALDVPHAIDHFRYFAGWADKIHGKTIPVDGPYMAYTLHEPLGVVGQIIPWNFPLVSIAVGTAATLAAGNALVLKPAEQTPLSALMFGQLALEVGIPEGVINIVPGYGPTAGAALAGHPGIDKIAFTGSTEVGRQVAAAAAASVKPCTLELGGKSPVIVCPSANFEEAVQWAHMGLFMNGGQVCTAGSRTFVHESIYDEFVAAATTAAEQRKVGDPFSSDVDQGPQVDADQMNKILHYINLGQEQGASMMCGGKRMGDKGYFIEPTVFADVKDHMAISREEIFGPVQSILKWSTVDEVIHRANNTPYGLAASVFAKDIDMVNTMTRGLRAGTVWVNCHNIYSHGVPHGGYKGSGYGRERGEYALAHFTQVKSVYMPLWDWAWR